MWAEKAASEGCQQLQELGFSEGSGLLKASGYKGEEIVIQSSNGRYFKGVEINQAVETYVQQAGINVKIAIVDWPTSLHTCASGQTARRANREFPR